MATKGKCILYARILSGTLYSFCLITLTSLFLNGCTYGILYTSSTTPYTLNMQETPRGSTRPSEGAMLVSIPATALTAGWHDRAIGDAAKEAGLKEIYYADLHTVSFLLGLWEKKTLQVYGK